MSGALPTGPKHLACEIADFVFELYPAPSADYLDQTGVGFVADDLPAINQQLAQAGYEPGPIKQNPWGLTFVVRDPDGRRVEMKAREGHSDRTDAAASGPAKLNSQVRQSPPII